MGHPYRLIWLNTLTFSEERSFNMTYWRVLILLLIGLALSFLCCLLSLRFTPLGTIFGFGSGASTFASTEGGSPRSQMESFALQLDSLSQEIAFRDELIRNLQGLALGTVPEAGPTAMPGINAGEEAKKAAETLANEPVGPAPEKIAETEQLVQTAGALAELQFFVAESYFQNDPIAFKRLGLPIKAVVQDSFAPRKGRPGLRLSAPAGSTVSAIQAGTVLWVQRNDQGLHYLALQHSNNLVSIYGGLGTVRPKPGERLRAGESLGLLAETSEPLLDFQLWFHGQALDPKRYIAF